MKISGNTILITGGTSGIGRALAEALHSKDNHVIIAGRRQKLLDEITAANPGMKGIRFDAEDAGSIPGFAAEVIQQFPKLNVLFNNAGIAGMVDYKADTIDTAHSISTVQVNITSILQLTAALLPHLRAQPASAVVTTTSGLAFVSFPMGPVYSGTKAFLHNWLDGLRFQLRGTSVEVLELAPPYVQTELGGEQQAKDPRAMPLADYTAEVMQLLESGNYERGEILVERVKPMRWAEKNGQYDTMLETLGSF